MNCPICKKELEIKNKKVGETADGEAIYNEFAICHDCKKQWNLDKQRAKANAAAKAKEEKEEKESKRTEKSKKTPAVSEVPSQVALTPKKKRPVSSDEQTPSSDNQAQPVRKVKKKRPINPETGTSKESVPSAAPKAEPERATKAAPEKARKNAPEKVTKAAPKKTTKAVNDTPTKVIPTEELEAKLQEIDALEEKPRKRKRPVPSDGQEQSVHKTKKKSTDNDLQKRADSNTEAPKKTRQKKTHPVESPEDDFKELSYAFEEEEKSEKKYSNIPPKHIREAREKEMRENYRNMLDDDDEDEEGGAPIILILIIIILLLSVAAFAGYWFLLR